MKPKSIVFIAFIILTLILIKIFFLKNENSDAPKATMKSNQPINVTAYIASSRLLEHKIFSSGSVAANEEVELRPELSGKLIAVYFKEGSTVRKGSLLAKINDADLQAQLRKQQLQYKLAKEREARLKGLLEINGVSQEEYDALVTQSQSINADIDFTRSQIAKTEIRAPFDGKIGLKQKSVGSYLSVSDIIATIQQLDVLKIDFTVPELYASLVSVGDTIHFSVDNKSEMQTAIVFAIEPRIDEQTRNIQIRAMYNNVHSSIFPGAFAKIELIANKKEASILIPTEAVIPELRGKKVYVFKAGKAVSVMVQTGTREDAAIEITEGLNIGDTIITTGIMSLKPNADVAIIGFKK